MFHAPSSESKQRNDPTRTPSTSELEKNLSAQAPWIARHPSPAGAGSFTSSLPPQQYHTRLHSTYGNQAVLRMLSGSSPAIQTKLTVNQPGDAFEQEADRVADQVMRLTGPAAIQRKCSSCEEEEKLQRKCADCEEEEKKEIHRKETTAGPAVAPPIVHDVLRSSGQPLDLSTRAFMEPRFGYDFSGVRVHTDNRAVAAANSLSANAFASGEHLVFAAGQYQPGGTQGNRLLAHELAHVVQSQPHIARQPRDPATVGQLPPHVPQAPTMPAPPIPQQEPMPTTCPADADKATQIAAQGIPARTTQAMRYAISIATARSSGGTMRLTDGLINQADAAIRAQFGAQLPSRSFSRGGTITRQTPQDFASSRVPDAATARLRIRQLALRTAGDALRSLCITSENDPVLESAVAVPVLADVGITTVRDHETAEIGGVTSFPTQANALPQVTLPTESRNLGHIVVHEAMHFYVHEAYRQAAELNGQLKRELMEGGAEFMARLVIQNQLSNDPNFRINYGTYSYEFGYVNTYLLAGGTFPTAYLQGRIDLLGLTSPANVHPKMKINQPDDPFEQEADRMADQVLRMADPGSLQRNGSLFGGEDRLQRKCTECEDEENKELQRQETSAGPQFAPPLVHEVLNSPGQPLDPATRAFMEPRFGRDFSSVRVHTDGQAAESARAVNALAYASGRDVVFASGQYSPSSGAGRRLLAHELAHVVQQGEGIHRACDTALVGARAAPVFFPKQAKIMAVFSGADTLGKGATDKEAVGLIQQALTDLCIDEGKWGPKKDGVDRKFGDDTAKGVEAFQKSEALPETGDVDKTTLRCLDETRSKPILPCKTGVPLAEKDLLIEGQRTGGADDDIFFARGDKTLKSEDKTKLAKVATSQKDTPITLVGFESEDEITDFGDKLAAERVDAVSAELGKDGQGDEATYRKKDPKPQASAGQLDYRKSRRVHIIVPGGPAPPDCTKIPSGWTHPDFGPCDAATEKIVQDAVDRGVKLMSDAITALKPGDSTAEKAVADRFGDKKHLPAIKAKLVTWKDHLDTHVRTHHECTNDCHSACIGTDAYTDDVKDTFLCAKLMRAPADKDAADEQALIILHEAGHGALGTKDVAYDATRLLGLIQKDFSLAEINTDSFVLLIQCLNGVVIHGMGCTVPKPGDTFPGMSSGPQGIAEEALAWLERWMDFVWQDVNNLYPAVVRARGAGKWDPGDDGEKSTMDLLAKDFGLRRPAGSPPPTMREETEVAAIHQRFLKLESITRKATAREFKRDDAATPDWNEVTKQVSVNKAFFDLKTTRERVRFLVKLVIHDQADISTDAEPAYVAFTTDDALTWFNKP